jgi:hypothetical protein
MSPSIWVYDIETTPNLVYSWGLWQQNIGINQIVEPQDILCFAAHKVGTKTVEAHAAWDDRAAMLQRLWEIMDDAAVLVGYNHAGFDNKHVNAALAKAGLRPPSPYRNEDLLRKVKKEFRLASHKLDYVCRHFGLDVKVSTGGMDLWTACMDGDEKAQRKMLRYNRQDVRITTQLYTYLKETGWLDNTVSPLCFGGKESVIDLDAARCTRCGGSRIQRRGKLNLSDCTYKQRFECSECGKWMTSGKKMPLVAAHG